MSNKQTRFLDKNKQLTITTDEFTTGYYYTKNPGQEPVGYTALTANNSVVIESTTTQRNFSC